MHFPIDPVLVNPNFLLGELITKNTLRFNRSIFATQVNLSKLRASEANEPTTMSIVDYVNGGFKRDSTHLRNLIRFEKCRLVSIEPEIVSGGDTAEEFIKLHCVECEFHARPCIFDLDSGPELVRREYSTDDEETEVRYFCARSETELVKVYHIQFLLADCPGIEPPDEESKKPAPKVLVTLFSGQSKGDAFFRDLWPWFDFSKETDCKRLLD